MLDKVKPAALGARPASVFVNWQPDAAEGNRSQVSGQVIRAERADGSDAQSPARPSHRTRRPSRPLRAQLAGRAWPFAYRGVRAAARIGKSDRPGPIVATLVGSDTAIGAGLAAHAGAPVLALCRKLIAAGHDPATPLEAYGGATLGLRVKSIGQAAQLRLGVSPSGVPIFKRQETCPAGSPIAPNRRRPT